MASPQLENGAIQIAHDLYLAIERAGFTGLERCVIGAVMYLTYGKGQTKAEIATEDIRYLLGAPKKLRTDRLQTVLVKLIEQGVIFRQELVNGKQLLGMQKDYDKWVSNDKMSPLINNSNNYITNNSIHSSGDKMSPPERLVNYVQQKSKFRYSLGTYKAELKVAKQIYIDTLAVTKDAKAALFLLKDYVDTNDWMRDNVKMQLTYMSTRFEAWMAQVPRKPRSVLEDEEITGKRYRYNVRLKQWEVAS